MSRQLQAQMHAAYSLTNFSGQSRDRQDSVLSRLRHLLPDGMLLNAVHRLDRDTSGILLLARDQQTYRQLSWQFQFQQVRKQILSPQNASQYI